MSTTSGDSTGQVSDCVADGIVGFSNERPAAASGSASPKPGGIDTTHYCALGSVRSASLLGSGALFHVDDALLRVDVLAPDMVRLKITRTGTFDEAPTCALVSEGAPSMTAEFDLLDEGDSFRVQTAAMSVVIGKAPFNIDAYRADGSAIFESSRLSCGASGAYLYLNDDFIVSRTCRREDAIYGLGEKTGHMNRKGRSFTLWNSDVLNPDAAGRFAEGLDKSDPRRDPTSTDFDPYYVSIPFFHHLSGASGAAAGFFIDNGYLGRFDFCESDEYRFSFCGGEYTEYVFAGPSLKEIVGRYTELTGRIQPPPIWALGYHQCRWHPYTQGDIEKMAYVFRAKSIPCDALWMDIEHMEGYRVFTWNEKVFPEVPKLLKRLKERKLRAITIVDPGVKAEPGYCVYDSGVAADAFCKTPGGHIYTGQVWPGRTAFPDFSEAKARRWWGELNAVHVQSGVAGIWNDMNEPATGDIADQAMRFGGGAYPHERFHNQYGMLMAMATQEGLLSAMPERRTFILSRAGFAGMQRYAANWMGDNMARWDHLWMSMPMAMGLGLSGQPFVGADIGGFAEDTNPELFVRWMQCGVLTPFCRNHNNAGCVAQYPWSFGEAMLSIIRKSIEMRYRLMPYLYSAFIDAAQTGLPIQRPLALDYQDDPSARAIEDQYLLGGSVMVAPVTAAGATARQVYLPKGEWRNYFTGERITGPRYSVEPTPMEHIPIFVKGGAVIPMWPEAPSSTMDYHPAAIELHVYMPGADGVYVSSLQEDDGITFGYREGYCYKTSFTLTRHGAAVSLDARTSGLGYAEFARSEFTIIFHGTAPAHVNVDGQILAVHDARVTIRNAGESFKMDAVVGSVTPSASAEALHTLMTTNAGRP